MKKVLRLKTCFSGRNRLVKPRDLIDFERRSFLGFLNRPYAMNIFAVQDDPLHAAHQLPDKLVVKMPTETAQMLAQWAFFTHQVNLPKKDGSFYQITPRLTNHPCTQWLFESDHNVAWLAWHGVGLCEEHGFRYRSALLSPSHAAYNAISIVIDLLRGGEVPKYHTPFCLCMPDEYKCANPILSYRYYMFCTKHYAKWERKPFRKPDWWCDSVKHLALISGGGRGVPSVA